MIQGKRDWANENSGVNVDQSSACIRAFYFAQRSEPLASELLISFPRCGGGSRWGGERLDPTNGPFASRSLADDPPPYPSPTRGEGIFSSLCVNGYCFAAAGGRSVRATPGRSPGRRGRHGPPVPRNDGNASPINDRQHLFQLADELVLVDGLDTPGDRHKARCIRHVRIRNERFLSGQDDRTVCRRPSDDAALFQSGLLDDRCRREVSRPSRHRRLSRA